MLLTSSQVSVALSSGIVILFTSALFLSGYAIQQRTLRDLRIAIRPDPRPSPKIYLPDRFKISTTELADGTIIQVDGNGNPLEAGAGAGEGGTPDGQPQQQPQQQQQQQRPLVHVQVRPTIPQGGQVGEEPDKLELKRREETPPKAAADEKEQAEEKTQPAAKAVENQDGAAKPEKPISRAERRRRIKQEIRELSQGETPVYYQRRLW